jgi:uncharacterized protein (DUF58 family)
VDKNQKIIELLKEVSRIRIVASRQVNDYLAGEYLSVFKGRGMNFDEVREYAPGDDVRAIDWNVTARAGRPFVKRFSEERELTVIMAIDVSASGAFGSLRRSKMETAIEAAAALMFSALKNNDKVGLLFFAQKQHAYFPPRKGRSHVLRLIRELLAANPVREAADLTAALEYLAKVQRRRAVVFLLGDFLGAAWTRSASAVCRRHDVVSVSVTDRREETLPDVGFITLQDAETGECVELDARNERVRNAFAERARTLKQKLFDQWKREGLDHITLKAGESCGAELRRFFLMRARRSR